MKDPPADQSRASPLLSGCLKADCVRQASMMMNDVLLAMIDVRMIMIMTFLKTKTITISD